MHCKGEVEEKGIREQSPDFSLQGCHSPQGNCHCAHCWQPHVPPTSVCVLFPCFLTMATCYASFPPHHPSSRWSPSVQFVDSFSLYKVILQVKVGHSEACGLAVDWFLPKPILTPETEAQGPLKHSVADIQHLLIE